MANPFLFGAPAAGGGMPPAQPQMDNPFLAGATPSPPVMMQQPQFTPPVMPGAPVAGAPAVANPFLAGGGFGAAAPPTPQPQMGAFGQPMATPPTAPVAAANPFASFGAPAPAPAPAPVPSPVPAPAPVAAAAPPTSAAALFGAAPTSPPPVATVSSTMHQYHGQHGDYVQTTAGAQSSQPVTVSSSVPNANTSPFGVVSNGSAVNDVTAVSDAVKTQTTSVVAEEKKAAAAGSPFAAEAAAAAPTEEVSAAPEVAAAASPFAPVAEIAQEAPKPAPVAVEEPPLPDKAADDVPLPPPPPEEEKPAEAPETKEDEEAMPPPPPPVEPAASEDSPKATEAEEKESGAVDAPHDDAQNQHSTGASLFQVDPNEVPALPNEEDMPAIDENYSSEVKVEKVKSPSPPPPEPVKMSTGDAIFADLPATDMASTGAAIFGASEEAAVNTTGATLFDVSEPKAAQPVLGSMSGWDDAFDRKFDSASTSKAVDAFDAFGGGNAMMAAAAGGFGMPAATSGFGGATDDGFGSGKFDPNAPSAALAADLNNPFLNEAKGNQPAGGEDGDEILFDDDTSQPLQPFPRLDVKPDGWEFYIRHPPKKKLTAQRFWKKVYVRIVMQGDTPCIQLFESKEAKDAFQEVPLMTTYSVSDISHQVFDQYSKIFTLKVQFISYKERAGIRPGQISKLEALTGKIGALAKAVEDADYKGVKHFASDMKKLGVPLEHAPQVRHCNYTYRFEVFTGFFAFQVTELLKLGSENYEDLKQFTVCVEEKLFKMNAVRDRSLTYKTEEVQLNAIDEVYVEQDKSGHVVKQLCRVRVFFLSFLSGTEGLSYKVRN